MPTTATTSAPRGFVIDRADGRVQLPGSLHTNRRLSQWIALGADGCVQVFTGKAELGQGILGALQLIVAEELDRPADAITVVTASTARGPDEGMTSGSLSVQDSGGALRHVCAEVRGMALQRAAARSGLNPADLRVEAGRVVGPSGQVLGHYGSLLSAADLDIEYAGQHAPKPAGLRGLLGRTRLPRADLAAKVHGQARFLHDLRLPGMLHGRVLRPPLLDSPLGEGAQAALETVTALYRGVQAWADGRFVAVVAERERDAEAAADRLRRQLPLGQGAALPDMPGKSTSAARRGVPMGADERPSRVAVRSSSLGYWPSSR